MRVLVIEPNKLIQKILETIVRSVSIEVSIATSGEEGIKLLQQGEYAMVLISLHLDDMTGIEFTGRLRAMDGYKIFPVIMLTAEEDKQTIEDGLKAA